MEGEMVSAGGRTDADGVSFRDAASPARAVESADGDGTSNVPAAFDGGGVCD